MQKDKIIRVVCNILVTIRPLSSLVVIVLLFAPDLIGFDGDYYECHLSFAQLCMYL